LEGAPVTHMPEKLYSSSAAMSTASSTGSPTEPPIIWRAAAHTCQEARGAGRRAHSR